MSIQFFPFVITTALFEPTKKVIVSVIVLAFCAFSLFAQENTNMVNENDNAVSSDKVITVPDLKVPTFSLSQELGGRVAGVNTLLTADKTKTDSTKTKTDNTEFYIRCNCSSSLPPALVLVDGVEGSIAHLHPEDIESFSIFKDAAALAIYGERGANGVVVVTTKKGSKSSVESETNAATAETESLSAPESGTTQLENEDVSAIKADSDLTGTEDPFPDLKIYPNPFAGTLQLTGAENCILRVFSEDGIVVHTQKLINPIETIPLEHLRAGLYFFCVNNGKQTKLVKGVKNK